MRNDLPRQIHINECGIINLDDKMSEGTHWTSYIKRGRDITYFDSIGQLKPPLELIHYFRSGGSSNKVRYNYDQFQKLNSYNCGHLVLQFLYQCSS